MINLYKMCIYQLIDCWYNLIMIDWIIPSGNDNTTSILWY